ncbi:MAG: hypothetical protein SGI72_14565 [Planctomycetota bacterium]|nr:hypothetical protein [Planctomycetota bacterium]
MARGLDRVARRYDPVKAGAASAIIVSGCTVPVYDGITNSEIEVKIKSLDANRVVEGMEKIANRITMGLILAALIVGAALLMRVQTEFRLWGYPGFAMLCFLVAGAGGFWLVATSGSAGWPESALHGRLSKTQPARAAQRLQSVSLARVLVTRQRRVPR